MNNIVIPTSVFDYQQVDCQDEYAALIAASGGQGIEIRRELFPSGELPLEKCRRTLEQHRLYCVYSAPIELWLLNGELNESGLAMVIREAQMIQADMIKLSLGHYDSSRSNVSVLSRFLNAYPQVGKAIMLTVENDQTDYGGRLQPMRDFFKAVSENGLSVRMTFDIGNWTYCGENVLKAVELLSQHVVYVHCKHVEQRGNQMQTLPIPREPEAGWRKLLRLLPPNVLRAIEFPLKDVRMLPEYIALLREA
jgi:sugar phosphate isomerase/epimerase